MMPGDAMLFLFAVIMAALLLFMMVFFVSFISINPEILSNHVLRIGHHVF
jgi:hypothetical protein